MTSFHLLMTNLYPYYQFDENVPPPSLAKKYPSDKENLYTFAAFD